MRKQKHKTYSDCPIEASMDFIGGKWKASLLFALLEERRRFGELQKLFPKMTQRTLTRQLRDLETDGLIGREVFAEVPPRVEYRLLEKGRALQPALQVMFDWGLDHAIDGDGIALRRERDGEPAAEDAASRGD